MNVDSFLTTYYITAKNCAIHKYISLSFKRFKVLNEEALSATFKTFSGIYKPHPYTISASYNNTNYHLRSFISLHKLYLLSSSDMQLLFSMTPMIIIRISMPWKYKTFRLPFITFFHIRCNFRYIKMNGKLM